MRFGHGLKLFVRQQASDWRLSIPTRNTICLSAICARHFVA